MQTILVQMANLQWTTQALHLACALARNDQSRVILLRLTEIQHIRNLGLDFANIPLTPQEYSNLAEYSATAEDYGVEISVAQMQCVSPLNAVVSAAEHVKANVVFVHIPDSRIPFVRRLRLWQLERQFAKAQRQFYTLDTSRHEIVQSASSTVISPPDATLESSEQEHLPLDTF